MRFFSTFLAGLFLATSPVVAVRETAVVAVPVTKTTTGITTTTTTTTTSPAAVAATTRMPARGGGGGKGWKMPSRRRTLIQIGCLLAFNNGYMNGLGLGAALKATIKTPHAVAAVTGAWTGSALGVHKGTWQTPTTMIFSYMFGSALQTLINPTGSIRSPLPVLVAGLLVATAQHLIQDTVATWACLVVATGMTNSWTSQLCAGNLLRSAHFSGLTSDIGSFLGQIVRGNSANAEKCRIFAMVGASSWTGGFFSVLAAQKLGTHALTLAVSIYLATFVALVV